MSSGLFDIFSLRGRTSLRGYGRLQRRLILLAAFGWLAPIGLLMLSAPRWAVFAPFLVLPVVTWALLAAHVRRLHDVGVHAGHEVARVLVMAVMVIGPLLAALVISDLPPALVYALFGASFLGLLVASLTGYRRPRSWHRGDPGSNAFGPPPP